MSRQRVQPRVYRSLTEYFAKSGDTRERMATRLGVHNTYIGKIAAGQRTPALKLALAISAEANVPLETLLGWTPKRDRSSRPAKAAGRAHAEIGAC